MKRGVSWRGRSRKCAKQLVVWALAGVMLGVVLGRVNAQAQLDANDIQALTARTVLGIISYARWPVQPEVYRLCLAGDNAHLQNLNAEPQTIAGHDIQISQPSLLGQQWLAQCDILYLGAMPRSQRLALLKTISAQAILTIGEGDEMCADGMMFCLDAVGPKAVLQTNLDAIARSGIRINPNVLLLLRPKATQP